MTDTTLFADDRSAELRVRADPGVLGEIKQSGVEFVIWRRTPDPILLEWVDRIADKPHPHGRVWAKPDKSDKALRALFEQSGVPLSAGAEAFIADAKDLATRYSHIAKTGAVDLRVDHVRHDACWKFHRDNVGHRMICTYSGPGTEYVPFCSSARALADQRDYNGPIERVRRFDVALFKGVQKSRTGIVHRSPPIAGTGTSRLVVCLNVPNPDLEYDIYD